MSSQHAEDFPNSVDGDVTVNREAVTKSPKLLERMRDKMRLEHYAIRTERAYLEWAERYLRYHREARGTWVHP